MQPLKPWSHKGYVCTVLSVTTVFARSDAATTIYFIARVCAAFIRERHLLIPVAAREAILREMVDWHHWSRRFWPLCWCRRWLELVLDCLSCTYHRERVARHVHVLRASRIVGVVRRLFRLSFPEVWWLFRSSLPEVRQLFESDEYSRAASDRVNTASIQNVTQWLQLKYLGIIFRPHIQGWFWCHIWKEMLSALNSENTVYNIETVGSISSPRYPY